MLSVFNHLLVAMTAFDTVYLVMAVAEYSFVESFHLTSDSYDVLFVYFIYPVMNLVFCCSIFTHVALAFERYLAVCHPELVYASNQAQRRKGGGGETGGRAGAHSRAEAAVRKKVSS